jgi:uncharacterized protein YbaR (Trm112 family)
MFDARLLKMLVCPETHTPLHEAEGRLIERLNRRAQAGRLVRRNGRPVEKELSGGLVRADGDLLFPIIDDIPVLLLDEAIPLGPDRD